MIKSDGLISVIIPVYNVDKYLPQCLESVCAQTYKALEIILVDDGSTDRSGEICDEWSRKDPRIKVMHKKNGGVSSARNAGLMASSGALIGFVDADDWLEPEMYEKLVEVIQNADAVSCGFMDYPYGKEIPVSKGTKRYAPCGFEDAVIALFERNGYFSSVWNKLFRRNVVFLEQGPVMFDTSLAFGEDEVWLITVLSKCRKMAFVPEVLYHWRPREGSTARDSEISKKRLSIVKSKRSALRFLKRKDVRELAEGRMYNDCYSIKVDAYCAGNKAVYRMMEKTLRPLRRFWVCSREVSKIKKIKMLLLEIEMRLGMPRVLVRYTNSLNKNTRNILKQRIRGNKR